MFRLEAADIRVGGRYLLKSVCWQVATSDRVGLVGPNGSGKTTLLKTLAKLHELDHGKLIGGKEARFGYLPQDGVVVSQKTIFEEARSVFSEILEMKAQQEGILAKLQQISADDPSLHDHLEELQHLEDRFQIRSGYQIDAEIGSILQGLGFSQDDWGRPVSTFSGGWQMRLALAKLLLLKPNLLLLDEPTNHLDLESREWLAEYLRRYPFALVLVAHDRFFLDQVVTRITEIENKSLVDYFGNYSSHAIEKRKRQDIQLAAYKQQQEEISRIEAFVERFRYKATKATQVQSRLKALQKMERLVASPVPPKSFRFKFPEPPRSGDIVVELIDATRRYGPRVIFRRQSISIHRGEKVALVGPNGSGKSTLSRVLSAQDPLDDGIRRLGHKVLVSYFAQDQAATLPPDDTVLESLERCAPQLGENELRTLLGSFLFSADDVNKRVRILSGGEKNRLALCRLLTRPGNLLILDEPTNHLDILSKEVLLSALRSFAGTIVFVSHDRNFLDRLATRIIEVGHGQLYSYPGTYSEFLHHEKIAANEGCEAVAAPAPNTKSDPSRPTKPGAQAYLARKRESRERNRLTRRSEEVQREIATQETELADIEDSMANPHISTDFAKLVDLDAARHTLQQSIDALYVEWEELSKKLEPPE